MNRAIVSLVLLATVHSVQLAHASLNRKLIVHEWGTFTSMQGSNGKVIAGMHHEEEELPSFVHGRDPLREARAAELVGTEPGGTRPPILPITPPRPRPRCSFKDFECDFFGEVSPGVNSSRLTPRFPVTQKLETPVLYFYSEVPQKVMVDVQFPGGVISQYYPMPNSFSPPIGKIYALANGAVSFIVDVLTKPVAIPQVDPSSVYGPSRNVAANYIKVGEEAEKLIFYRGLGDFTTPFSVTSRGERLTVTNHGAQVVPFAMLLHSGPKGIEFQTLGEFGSNGSQEISAEIVARLRNTVPRSAEASEERAALALEQALVNSGLYADESKAMVDTWRKSYFRTPGLRVLYVVPREETDRLLPIQISPAPSELVRTLVGRVEIFTELEEATLLAQINNEQDQFLLTNLGRMAEPKLRRLLELAGNTSLRALIERLIARIE